MMHKTEFVGNCQVMEPWTKIAYSHCYGATTVFGYEAHTRGFYLYAIANDKLEQLEKNHSKKNTYQARYNKKVAVKEKAIVYYSKKKLLHPFEKSTRCPR
jgi:hypothetical protein